MHWQPSFPGAQSKITSPRALNANYLIFLLLCFYANTDDKKWADSNYSGVFFAILKLPTCQELCLMEFEWALFCVSACVCQLLYVSLPVWIPIKVSGCRGMAIKLIDLIPHFLKKNYWCPPHDFRHTHISIWCQRVIVSLWFGTIDSYINTDKEQWTTASFAQKAAQADR